MTRKRIEKKLAAKCGVQVREVHEVIMKDVVNAVLQAGIPESAVQRLQPRMDLSERGEDLFWQHVPHAGQIQLSGQSL